MVNKIIIMPCFTLFTMSIIGGRILEEYARISFQLPLCDRERFLKEKTSFNLPSMWTYPFLIGTINITTYKYTIVFNGLLDIGNLMNG